ncbi:hypothetical protein [Parachryseolinea silvisoli]|uniref:hypothetical protein n=1 Tax=Parachryseolinea silvisoli TaxID=2873601 RepID=UPI002265C6AF|nr:hypothetical protein [Parachryseolinea silvisoli]MCD9018162.1 hypothetical protein [Parachryseolinea silvisoli]
MIRLLVCVAVYCLLPVLTASAIVKYDEGRIEVNGIQLLQDSENSNAYYYIPPYPRVSVLENGDFEFSCIKYTGGTRESSGGLFHVLVQFSLSPNEARLLEKKLRERFPKASLMGAVPMQEYDDRETAPGFRIVSTILNPNGESPFTARVITSGSAPFLPGSKAAIAAHLPPEGATLLWESFSSATSDVSVVVEGYFRAKIKAYKARVNADLELVYNHFSSFKNKQSGFSRQQASHVLDSLCQTGAITIDVADMTAGLDVKSEVYQNILNIITERVLDTMFDVNTGWAKAPATTTAAQPSDLKERYQRGAFVRFFVGDGTQQYIPDDQLVLKSKKEIRSFHFTLDMTQSTVIKVPVYSAGNIRGFYDAFKDDKRYFRIVDMNDPDFQQRDIHFQIDGAFTHAFGDIIDQASILVQKDYPDTSANSYSGVLQFNKMAIDSGNIVKSLTYQRLGDRTNGWLHYKYKVGWKFIGVDSMVTTPATGWLSTDLPSVSIQPPLKKTIIELGVDKQLLDDQKIQTISVRFASILFGRPYKGKMLLLRNSDTEPPKATIYHDAGQPIVYQVSWYSGKKKVEDDLKVLADDYLFLIPPDMK